MCRENVVKLHTVTLTGADESVDPGQLSELSKRFPFVEWGILISPKRQGLEPRYPSRNWMTALRGGWLFESEKANFRLSAHLCGSAARDVFAGDDAFFRDKFNLMFSAVQLNGFAEMKNELSVLAQVIARRMDDHSIILQVKDQESVDMALELDRIVLANEGVQGSVSVLYDISGGTGVMPLVWRDPPQGIHFGYAGGIGPDNVEGVLQILTAKPIVPGYRERIFSIDMESSLRSKDRLHDPEYDRFDLDKARRVLEIVEPYVRVKLTRAEALDELERELGIGRPKA